MRKAAAIALKKSLGLSKKESILIVTDTKKEYMARVFLNEAKKITKKAALISMAPRKVNGEEPTKKVAKAMREVK